MFLCSCIVLRVKVTDNIYRERRLISLIIKIMIRCESTRVCVVIHDCINIAHDWSEFSSKTVCNFNIKFYTFIQLLYVK